MKIAIDFDGTCVTHEYPRVGRDIGAGPVLRELVAKGHQLILWTMRCEETLADAVVWFEENGVQLWAVNKNPDQFVWTSSPKAYAQLYIDDAALGVPLTKRSDEDEERLYVDWPGVRIILEHQGILDRQPNTERYPCQEQ